MVEMIVPIFCFASSTFPVEMGIGHLALLFNVLNTRSFRQNNLKSRYPFNASFFAMNPPSCWKVLIRWKSSAWCLYFNSSIDVLIGKNWNKRIAKWVLNYFPCQKVIEISRCLFANFRLNICSSSLCCWYCRLNPNNELTMRASWFACLLKWYFLQSQQSVSCMHFDLDWIWETYKIYFEVPSIIDL